MMTDSPLLASITYTRTSKEVHFEEQRIRVSEHTIHLHEEFLTVPDRVFPLDQVWDISIKPFSGEKSFLYLHTNQGMSAYEIVGNPEPFVETFRKLKGRY